VAVGCEGAETEVLAGTAPTKMTRQPYCMSYTRHIDDVQHVLKHQLAANYVDVVEHNKMRSVDRAKAARLRALKVHCYAVCPKESEPLNILQQQPQICSDLNKILHTLKTTSVTNIAT